MPKITIELDDTLQDRVNSACEDVKEELLSYLASEKPDALPELCDLDNAGAIHSIIDSAVPVYTREIETAWFLHGSDLESAYEDSGIGENPRENNGMTAIYCYIEQQVHEWYRDNAEEIFENWKEGVNNEGE